MSLSLQEQFGQIDIYVFDQMLRGNIAPGMRVLDAGCGTGRVTEITLPELKKGMKDPITASSYLAALNSAQGVSLNGILPDWTPSTRLES